MLTIKDFESRGFKFGSDNTSPYTGEKNHFVKSVDRGHVVRGHDVTEVDIHQDGNQITIALYDINSHGDPGVRVVFHGRCDNVETLDIIIAAVLDYRI